MPIQPSCPPTKELHGYSLQSPTAYLVFLAKGIKHKRHQTAFLKAQNFFNLFASHHLGIGLWVFIHSLTKISFSGEELKINRQQLNIGVSVKVYYFKCFGITAVGFDSVVLTLKVIIGFNINIVILLWESAKAFRPGWPDLAKFRHFGKNLEIYGNIFKVNLYLAKCWTHFGTIFMLYDKFS